jgi:hypothetical protein
MQGMDRKSMTLLMALGAATTLGGCAKPESEPPKQPLAQATSDSTPLPPGLTPAAAAHLDSGNVAYRAKDYPTALGHYRAAAAAAPEASAPWYGVFMVAEVTSNKALADSANARVAQLSGGAIDGSMAKAHSGGDAAGGAEGALPPGHPSTSQELPPGHPAPTAKPPAAPGTKGGASGL